MNSKLIVIFSFSILYAFFEFFMNLRQKHQATQVKSGDQKSIWVLIGSIAVGYWLSFLIGATKTGRIYPWNRFFTIGAILIVAGLVIRINSIWTLKKQFTYTVARIENHTLIQIGLYRYLRHPSYLGQLLIFTGSAISLSNWLSVICMLTPVSAGFLYRIRIEEDFMKLQIGQPYIDYQTRTKRLIPFVF